MGVERARDRASERACGHIPSSKRETDRPIDRGKQTDRLTYRERERETDRQIKNIHRDRQTA